MAKYENKGDIFGLKFGPLMLKNKFKLKSNTEMIWQIRKSSKCKLSVY